MRTVTPTPRAARFALGAVAASLGLFAFLRLPWVEAHLVLPLTNAQAGLAVALLGAPALPVVVTLACSGADALALCLGVVLAYPVRWRTRAAGAGGAVVLLLLLNTLRIGSLGRAAASAPWFNALHLYLWPAVLTLAIAAYVMGWMQLADRSQTLPTRVRDAAGPPPRPTRRFAIWAVGLLLVFTAVTPLVAGSASVLAIATLIAGTAATILSSAGVQAHAAANVLWTPRGGFVVTQECLSTPVIPIYLAAVCAGVSGWPRRALWALAAIPIFLALAIARLLLVALPPALVASPVFLVHAFYQILFGGAVVLAAAAWRHGRARAVGWAGAGVAAGVCLTWALGAALAGAGTGRAALSDPQGALALLPPFQWGIYLALWTACFVAVPPVRFAAGIATLAALQAGGWLTLHALSDAAGLLLDVRVVRGWAIAGPVLIFAAVTRHAKPGR